MHIRQMHITDYDEIYALFLSCKGMGLNDLDDQGCGRKTRISETGHRQVAH